MSSLYQHQDVDRVQPQGLFSPVEGYFLDLSRASLAFEYKNTPEVAQLKFTPIYANEPPKGTKMVVSHGSKHQFPSPSALLSVSWQGHRLSQSKTISTPISSYN